MQNEDTDYAHVLEAAKRASTVQLLIKCARLVNEYALSSYPVADESERPRASHMSLYAHIDLAGTRLTELAERLGVSKQAVGPLVDDLERWGLVERRPDPADGRAKRVAFTAAGRDGMLAGLRHLRRIEDELAAAIGREHIDALRAALLDLEAHFEAT